MACNKNLAIETSKQGMKLNTDIEIWKKCDTFSLRSSQKQQSGLDINEPRHVLSHLKERVQDFWVSQRCFWVRVAHVQWIINVEVSRRVQRNFSLWRTLDSYKY